MSYYRNPPLSSGSRAQEEPPGMEGNKTVSGKRGKRGTRVWDCFWTASRSRTLPSHRVACRPRWGTSKKPSPPLGPLRTKEDIVVAKQQVRMMCRINAVTGSEFIFLHNEIFTVERLAGECPEERREHFVLAAYVGRFPLHQYSDFEKRCTEKRIDFFPPGRLPS